MGKRILLIDGHPDPRPERFLHALADAYRAGTEGARKGMRVTSAGFGTIVLILAAMPALGTSAWQSELQSVLRSKPDVAHGAELFRTCAACHGSQAAGTPDGSVPALAGQHASVVAAQLVAYRHGKRWDPRMERITERHRLTRQAIADVAGYISALPRLPSRGIGSGERVAHGAQVHAQRCQSCHGAGGEGDAQERVPLVAGQHYEYLVRQIHDAIDGRRPNMPRSHVRLLERLAAEDIEGVADYLSRLPPPGAERQEAVDLQSAR